MNIKECNPGMEVRCIKRKEYDNETIVKGEILTIEEIFDIGNRFGDHITFEEKEEKYYPMDFEPFNKEDKMKFKKGDRIRTLDGFDGEVMYIAEKEDNVGNRVAIKLYTSIDREIYQFIREDMIKKRYVVGEEILDRFNTVNEVRAVETDGDENIAYFCKGEDGVLRVMYEDDIKGEA